MKTSVPVGEMGANVAIIKEIFKRLGYEADNEALENYAMIKTKLDEKSILSIVLIKESLQCIYGVKFPEYTHRDGKSRYLVKIMTTLIHESIMSVQNGDAMKVSSSAMDALQRSGVKIEKAPGEFQKIFDRFRKLFHPSKN